MTDVQSPIVKDSFFYRIGCSSFLQFIPAIVLSILVIVSFIESTNLQRGWILFAALFLVPIAFIVGILTAVISFFIKKKSTSVLKANMLLLAANIVVVLILILFLQ